MAAAIWANVVAGLALVIAIASAVFSWKSAAAAKLANRLVIHSYQKELHNSFVESYRYLKLKGDRAESQQFFQFEKKVGTANLYVSSDLSEKLFKYHALCAGIEELTRRVSHAHGEQSLIKNLPDGDDAQKAAKEDAVSVRLHSNIGAQIAGVTAAKELGRSIDKDFKDELKIL